MKSNGKIRKAPFPAEGFAGKDPQNKPLEYQVGYYKQEKAVLLDLSDAITRVREKSDLIRIFSSKLKDLFYFTHAVISLIDKQSRTYYPFLFDIGALHIRHRNELPSLLANRYFTDDPFISMAAATDLPVSFLLDDIMNKPGIPAFLKINYETGIREAMIVKLKNKMETIGFVFIYSDRNDSFSPAFKAVLQSIAPLLANAVANIIINDQVSQKEKDQSFLLSFSHSIASARTRTDLSRAIHEALKELSEIRTYFIRTIEDGGKAMIPFMYDGEVLYKNKPEFKALLSTKIPVDQGITARVMQANEPVTIDFTEEISHGNTDPYIDFWRKLGPEKAMFQKITGTPLRVGNNDLGILWVITDKINRAILDGICAQISVAIANIRSNEEIVKREEEKSFLLNFSNDIAAVRTREELESVITNGFQNLLHIKLSMIRLIDDDGVHLTPYMYDRTAPYTREDIYQKLFSEKLTIHEELTERVLLSNDPVIFNIEQEERNGNKGPYLYLWKKAGFQNVYGAPLRAGNTDLGTLWLLTDQVNLNLLKGICAQISIAIANIKANEKVLAFQQKLVIENDHLKEQIQTIYNSSDIIGSGQQMQRIYSLVSMVAPSNSTVLLLGETGTGKELMARAIHHASPRRDKLMIKINCAALPVNLIESEVFGHEKGAFTGAIDRRIGKFELANGSTLFLDEIGEMPLETQVKLLRVIQERELERIGGKTAIKVDVRIIAATNRNLEEEIRAGRFRADLYYRLNVFPITLPPLRHRVEDIEPLAGFFLSRYSKNSGRRITAISAKVMKELKSYPWPGNVRELEHLIERSVLLTQGAVLEDIQLPKGSDSPGFHLPDVPNKSLQEVERSYIIETLRRCDGKIAGTGGAAGILGIPSTTLHSKLLKLNISKADYFIKKD